MQQQNKDEFTFTFRQCLPYLHNQDDGNDDICFNCKLNGELFCCDNCFRAYHKSCLDKTKAKEIDNINSFAHFICEYCQTPKKCLKCKLNINPLVQQEPSENSHDSNHTCFMSLSSRCQNQFLVCTSCYAYVHKKCEDISLVTLYHKYTQIDTNQLQVVKHYICQNCLNLIGVQNLLTSKKIINKIFQQKMYHLVRLYSLSPIHYGWFQESVMSHLLQDLIAREQSLLQNLGDDSGQSLINCRIEKVIEMKIPFRFNQYPLTQILHCIEIKNQNFNHKNYGFHQNVQYLIKWQGKDYSSLSWQDQSIVFLFKQQINMFNSIMMYRFFIAENILQRSMKLSGQDKKTLDFILKLQQQISHNALNSQKKLFKQISKNQRPILQEESKIIKKMKQFQQTYKTQLIQFSKQYTSFNIKCLIHYLNNIYTVQFKVRPTVIVSNNLQRWEKSLRQLCMVNFIVFKGSKHNVDCIKQRQFTITTEPPLFKFQIILLSYQYFQYQKEFIFKSVPYFYSFIFDVLQTEQYLTANYLCFNPICQKQLILFNDDKNDKIAFINALIKIYEKHNKQSKKCGMVHRDFNFTNVLKIKETIHQKNVTTRHVSQDSIQRKLKIINQRNFQHIRLTNQILTEIQRIAFLKFILTWGLNFQTFDQIYQKLITFCRGIFVVDQAKKGQQLKKKLQQYLTNFMALLNNYQHHNVITDFENHYLFKSKQSSDVYKRICQLSKLKKKVQQFKETQNQFPFEKQFSYFAMKQVKTFPKWNASEDYTLAAMIIEKGFDRWLEIGQSRSWTKYHQQVQTIKIARYIAKTGQYEIQQQQVIGQQRNNLMELQDKQSGKQKKPVLKYFEYLHQKLKSAKDLDRKKNFQIQSLIQQRGHYLLRVMK